MLGHSVSAQDADSVRYVGTLEGAYLNSGNGTDRLGGNKMGFIEEGIVLQVLGEEESLYKVRLSENRYAYIPKEYAADTAVTDFAPVITSGSISVSNAGKYDELTHLAEKYAAIAAAVRS